jgi:uncharacterized surface protein with fasciclin (FAS1) repeats
MHIRTLAGAALALALAVPAAAQEQQAMAARTSNDIVETAKAAGSFGTLLAAVDAAGLTTTLKGTGPFTVFAPTDAAFGKLPAGAVDGLLKDRPALTKVLTYHVVAGKLTAADLVARKDANGYVTLTTVEGSGLKIHIASSGAVHVGDEMATVVKADVMAENGVIHVIDKVVMPEAKKQGY